MPSILDASWLDLGPTDTYARRVAFWAPGVSLTHADGDDRHAAVKIHQTKGQRSGCKREVDLYAVEYHGEAPTGHQFTFLNLYPDAADPNSLHPYIVAVGRGADLCTCKAGKCRVQICKHRSSCLAALKGGFVPGVEVDDAPSGVWCEGPVDGQDLVHELADRIALAETPRALRAIWSQVLRAGEAGDLADAQVAGLRNIRDERKEVIAGASARQAAEDLDTVTEAAHAC